MIIENKNLKSLNTFGIDVNARWYAEVFTPEDLQQLREAEWWNSTPQLIIGGGSNMLLTKDFDGLVIKNSIHGIQVVKEDQDRVWVKVGSGEIWHDCVLYCIDRGWGGIENLSLIPGSVGAAPIQNIGAYGVELKDVFHELTAWNLEDGSVHTFTGDDCEFGYRDSFFKREGKGKFFILSVTLVLNRSPKINISYGAIESTLTEKGIYNPTIKQVSDAVISIRKSKLPDPSEIGNSGSFFKNPVIEEGIYSKLREQYPDMPSYPAGKGMVKLPAGWLIDQAGWKGYKSGAIGVHKNQALVLVNYGEGRGEDLKGLAFSIIDDIEKKYGIRLEPEVNIL